MSSTSLSLTSGSTALKPVNNSSTANTQQRTNQARSNAPATPKPQTPPLPSQPGTWTHPMVDVIAKRQNKAVFNSENARSACQNAIFFVVSIFAPSLAASYTPKWLTVLLDPYHAYVVTGIRIFFLASFLYAFRPLLFAKDEIDDIPLTPSQRALLGLKPSGTPMTPGSQFITPPRYSRSGTPLSAQSDRARSQSPFSGSPLDGRARSGSIDRGMGQSTNRMSGSPYSGSPLVQKALTGSTGRRMSFDTTGGSSSSGLPSTPTPIGAGRASVGLNNKWLYERGRGSPNGRNLFS
ncbi:hypothetical protein K461DRAFT_241144 [Myriangium duriaei CBS 260.36]|uniref:Nuclear pore complex component n=1 Tax=Myriangium duriaei CBS 260.36 TaxID=1168546 RepID=A0A9P4MGG1_9PEZI|nr:hypothetical protein K461DRAFT_241144 [Myriangium duriaei CBS 260.36]